MNRIDDAPLVYVVDDDRAVRDSLSWLLGSAGYQVFSLSSAESFLLAYQPGAAVCLILDVRLPGMSGLELQRELKSRGERLPIIFISADNGVKGAVDPIECDTCHFVEKPVNDDELVSLIRLAASANNSLGTSA